LKLKIVFSACIGLLVGCGTPAENYTDKQLCFMGRVWQDGVNIGMHPDLGSDELVGHYQRWGALKRNADSVRTRGVNCEKTYKVNSMSKERFIAELSQILPVPSFYGNVGNQASRRISGPSNSSVSPEALIALGAAISAGASASPPTSISGPKAAITIDAASLCPLSYGGGALGSSEVAGMNRICYYR
jgi:hypothetical protein